MKMGGQLLESKVAIYDGIGNEELYIYSDNIVSLNWSTYLIDDRIFSVDDNFKERITLKQTGIYKVGYSINTELEWSNQRDNVKIVAYLNGQPLSKTVSYSYMRNEATGDATNSFTGNVVVDTPNSVLEIRMQRNNEYKGVIALKPPECSLNLKRERPL